MTHTAKELQDFAHASICVLVNFPNRNNASVYRELAEYSGLSASLVRDFHHGVRDNLTTDSLDRMVAAVKKAMIKAAA